MGPILASGSDSVRQLEPAVQMSEGGLAQGFVEATMKPPWPSCISLAQVGDA